MPQYLVIPTNSVLAEGAPHIIEVEIGANATAAKMLPNRAVIHDATDGDVKEAGADATTFMGILMEKSNQTYATAYAVGDPAKIIIGGDCIVKMCFASAAAGATPGTKIGIAADGKAKAYSAGICVGLAMTTVAANGPDADILVNVGAPF